MRYENRLSPFQPRQQLLFQPWSAAEVHFHEDEATYAQFGFKPHSKQARFFTNPAGGAQRVVGVLYEPTDGGAAPRDMADPRVVSRLFGTLDRDGALELWHISVNPANALNDSQRGTRWGVHNIVSREVNGKTRWATLDGANLTQRTARAHVRGTPNPYAVECLVRCAETLRCPSVRQHDAMPCAKLFNPQYDQRTHPGTMLLYEALKFERARDLPQYVWHRSFMPGLAHSHARCVAQMAAGLSVV